MVYEVFLGWEGVPTFWSELWVVVPEGQFGRQWSLHCFRYEIPDQPVAAYEPVLGSMLAALTDKYYDFRRGVLIGAEPPELVLVDHALHEHEEGWLVARHNDWRDVPEAFMAFFRALVIGPGHRGEG